MEFISKASRLPTPSPTSGFWIRGDEVFDVTHDTHLQFIIQNAQRFDLTRADIDLLYDFHDEEVGTEQLAQEDLIRLAKSNGWIKVRRCASPQDRWSIQCNDSVRQKAAITESRII